MIEIDKQNIIWPSVQLDKIVFNPIFSCLLRRCVLSFDFKIDTEVAGSSIVDNLYKLRTTMGLLNFRILNVPLAQ